MAGLLAVVLALAISGCQATKENSAQGQSRRISTCGFAVVFAQNDVSLDSNAKRVIADAISEASHNGDNSMTLSFGWGVGEPMTIAARREAVIAGEITRRGTFDGPVRQAGLPSESVPDTPEVIIGLCDPYGTTHVVTPKPPPDKRMIVLLRGRVHMAVPFRDLGPAWWRDIPVEPLWLGELELKFAWSRSKGELTELNVDCHEARPGPCDPSISLRVSTRFGSAEAPAEFDGLPPSELRRIPGEQLGLEFYRIKNPGRGTALLVATTSSGARIFGECYWRPPGPGVSTRNAAEILLAIRRGSMQSDCAVRDAPLGGELYATFDLGGDLLLDWQRIYASIVRRTTDYRDQATSPPGH